MNVNRAAIMYDMAELEAWIAIDPNPSDEKLAIIREALARLDALAAPKAALTAAMIRERLILFRMNELWTAKNKSEVSK